MAKTRKTLNAGIALFIALCLVIVVVAGESTLSTSKNASASGAHELTQKIAESSDIESRCAAVRCDAASVACPDGYNASCENACDEEAGTCSSCTPSCEGHAQEASQAAGATEEGNKTEEETAEAGKENVSEDGATNETQTVEANASSSEQGAAVDAPAAVTDVEMNLTYPAKVIRGGGIAFNVSVTNKGLAEIHDFKFNVTTPAGFEILSIEGAECETLSIGETCVATVRAKVSPSAALGKNLIKIKGGENNA